MGSFKMEDLKRDSFQRDGKQLVYDKIDSIQIKNKQFTIIDFCAFEYHSGGLTAMTDFIEKKGGRIRPSTVNNIDYVILCPINVNTYVSKPQMDKYQKALDLRAGGSKLQIIRDVDFFIYFDMFSNLKTLDKKRMLWEYSDNNPLFNDENSKKIKHHIEKQSSTETPVPRPAKPIEESLPTTIGQWRQYYGISEKNGELIITNCKLHNKSISIPDAIEGKPVVEIKSRSFFLIEDVEEVIVPASVRMVRELAFQNCLSLKKIIFEGDDITIQNEAFSCCEALEQVIFKGRKSTIKIGKDPFFKHKNASLMFENNN